MKRTTHKAVRRRVWMVVVLLAVVAVLLAGQGIYSRYGSADPGVRALRNATLPEYVTQDLIPKTGTARSGRWLEAFNGIVIHYVGNPGTSAAGNRSYFASAGTPVVSHFVVGLEGEVIQCLPLWERSVASNHRNGDTISIEVCHPDDSGRFTDATYGSLVRLTAWLCQVGELSTDAVIRHYDVTGKECPRYFVQHPEAWEQFLADLQTHLE